MLAERTTPEEKYKFLKHLVKSNTRWVLEKPDEHALQFGYRIRRRCKGVNRLARKYCGKRGEPVGDKCPNMLCEYYPATSGVKNGIPWETKASCRIRKEDRRNFMDCKIKEERYDRKHDAFVTSTQAKLSSGEITQSEYDAMLTKHPRNHAIEYAVVRRKASWHGWTIPTAERHLYNTSGRLLSSIKPEAPLDQYGYPVEYDESGQLVRSDRYGNPVL